MHRPRHFLSGRSAGSILAIATILASGCAADDADADETATDNPTNPTTTPSDSSGETTDATATTTDSADESSDETDPTLNPTSDTSDTRVVPCETPVDAEFVGSLAVRNAEEIAILQQYSAVTGGIAISGEEITSLDFMACVTSIGGSLQVFGTTAEDLGGLGNLTTLGGSMSIAENLNLTEIWGFEGLTETGGGIVIQANPALTGVFGFDELLQVGAGVTIEENPVLSDVDGFGSLVAIGTDVSGAPNYPDLIVTTNPELLSIRGLVGIQALSGQLIVRDNPKLCISEIQSLADMLEQWIQEGEGSTTGNDNGC